MIKDWLFGQRIIPAAFQALDDGVILDLLGESVGADIDDCLLEFFERYAFVEICELCIAFYDAIDGGEIIRTLPDEGFLFIEICGIPCITARFTRALALSPAGDNQRAFTAKWH
ncbi:MAG: hypothetical protein QOH32_716 [Bradyrhizobium sp.]|jgi:hypothetical protein|nr:hypothetical protein [Bradyrhizobium sp.]